MYKKKNSFFQKHTFAQLARCSTDVFNCKCVDNMHWLLLQTAPRNGSLEYRLIKRCVLKLGIQLSDSHLFINNHEIHVVLQARDLGILVSDSLSPTAHVLHIVRKAHRSAKLIHLTGYWIAYT